ncbi:rRNA processing protein [Lasiodiplodia theobromae]|uniref:rRNA-processing protein EBP2 n=1 Tax=Lasiodiplodia theobromae TaxID=45133 RepID=A0A5N5DFV3_9PEZI|nr:rRNA processing protein [Lasiodiplodia theobromae]KAB2576380.1 rRNA-processing protein EBP2 [Lasiodiplodia theobromae]KAF4543991.1 rRNA processing protein [Lasiodiplodia theobromae]
MVKKGGSKLLNLLQKEKGYDYKKDKQKKLQKQAEKRKQEKKQEDDDSAEEDEVEGGVSVNAQAQEDSGSGGDEAEKQIRSEARKAAANKDESEDEEDSDEEETPKIDLSRLEDDDSDSSGEELEENDDEDDDDDEEEDIALSDLESVASDEKGDIIPHQRLTINNTSALLAAAHRIEWKTKKQAFSDHQAVTSDAAIEIQDTNDDLNRELAFYQQALAAVNTARAALKKEGVPFTRPNDYFAEMVKSDEHMGKIKQKLIDEAAGKKAAAEARRQRDLKKFGKAVQIAKEQEKAKAKKDTMEKINLLKRKRQGADLENENEDDLFDVALEDAEETARKDKLARRAGAGGRGGHGPNPKRAKKDAKYGFGGKKRFAKSNDAQSSADGRGFSAKKMKAGANGAKKRPGKSRRAARK